MAPALGPITVLVLMGGVERTVSVRFAMLAIIKADHASHLSNVNAVQAGMESTVQFLFAR